MKKLLFGISLSFFCATSANALIFHKLVEIFETSDKQEYLIEQRFCSIKVKTRDNLYLVELDDVDAETCTDIENTYGKLSVILPEKEEPLF